MSGPGGTRPAAPVLAAALADVMRAFAAAEVPLSPEDLLDAAWLARRLPPPAAPAPEPVAEAPQPLAEAPEIAPLEREREPDPLTVEPPPPVAPEPTPAGDAVGLTLPRADTGGAPGRHFRAPTAPALPRARELSRALRPLARRVPSRVASVLDVAETVRRFADARVCDPALRPARERWLTLALVTDTGFGADLWADTAREFRTLLGTLGAFRDVRSWCLDTDGPPRLFAGARPGGAPRDARELIDPSGRTLVVVLSSCVTAAWRDGTAAGVLERWARRGPVLLVPLLPENLWPRTALAAATLVRATATTPGAGAALLRVEVPGAWPDDPLPKGVPVPVAVLTPASLRRWAGLVVARPGAAAPALILGAQEAHADATLAAEEVSGAERVALFRREASPLARRLAGLVAAAPVLNLPVVRLIRRSMLPTADQPHEAEVLFGGLLARAPGAFAEPRFEFRPGVRAALLDAAPTDESLAVLAGVSHYLGEHLATGATFASVFADPSAAAGVLAPDESPFAQVAAEVLVRAGGDYARMVRRAPLPGPGAPLSPPTAPGTSASPPAPRAPELDELPLGYESAPDPDEHRFRRAAALVIGIGQYAHPDLPPLPSACADAVAVAERLGDPSKCRFFPHSIAVLTDEVATRDAIDRHLWNWLAQEARGAELVVLYFAGYSANGYLLPYDADPHSPFASAIPIAYFAECANRLGRATLVCLDSHPDPSDRRRENRSTKWVRRYLGTPSEDLLRPRYVLVSGEDEQQLIPAAGGPHGLFAWHLLRGIDGAADRDGDGRVGAAELCEYVSETVARDARARGAEQTPWFVALAAGNDFVSTVAPGTESDPHTTAPEAPAEYWDELPNKPEEPTPVPMEPDPATAPFADEASQEFVPHNFGPYFLLGELGRGGMGTVYRARPLAGGPEVALKALHRRLHASLSALKRFSREYEVLQRIRHPGVVTALDFGKEDGTLYFVMELVPGETLDVAPPRDRAEAVRLIRRVAEAMERVHAAGVVHRDLKLANIIVRPDGTPVVLDFGVARSGADDEEDGESSGAPVGTVAYMPPEQVAGGPGAVSPRSDVYALGVALYKLLTGRLPFQGNFPELIPKITQGHITPPIELVPDLDPRLNAAVLRATALTPERRFPSMAAFAQALAAVEDAPAAPEPPPPVAADPQTVDPGDRSDRFAQLPCDFGPYRLQEQLWAGDQGRAAVFGGRDEGHDRPVVVTVLRGDAALERQRAFRDEAHILRRLSDRNVPCAPRVFDCGTIDGFEFVATERLNGLWLDEFWAERGGRLGPGGLARLVARVAREVGTLHRALAPDVLVHRNLNPRGILFVASEQDEERDGARIAIVGFATAAVMWPDGTRETGRGNVLVGAIEYFAPEAGTAPGPRSDVYSLGVVLYKLLTGSWPRAEDARTGDSGGATTNTRELPELRPPSSFDPRLAPFDAVCRTALAWRPADRYATMDAFAGALDALNAREKGLRSTDWEPAADVPAPAPPAEPPPFDREEFGDVTVVRLTDERLIDEARVRIVGEALVQLADRPGRKVALNLSRLAFATAALLGKLIRLSQQLRADGGALVLCNTPKDMLDLFAITKLNKTFTFARDEGEALKLLGSQ